MLKTALGQLVCTRGVAQKINDNPDFAKFVWWCVGEFLEQRWGDLCEEDRHQNDMAFVDPEEYGRILASYKHDKHEIVWIIREWDCSVTTILCPDEY